MIQNLIGSGVKLVTSGGAISHLGTAVPVSRRTALRAPGLR